MLNSEKPLLSFTKDNFVYKNVLHLFVCVMPVHTPTHGYPKMPWYMCGVQGNQVSPSTMSDWGIELGDLCCQAWQQATLSTDSSH